jgi:hypothetical protein
VWTGPFGTSPCFAPGIYWGLIGACAAVMVLGVLVNSFVRKKA